MPMLDVSWVVLDPMLADVFTVIRRTETVDSTGRPVIGSTSFPDQLGVITQEAPNALQRADDAETVPRVITVSSKFNLRGASLGYQPDLVIWNGTTYLVKQVLPYSRFGSGFYEATASSMTTMDVPQ